MIYQFFGPLGKKKFTASNTLMSQARIPWLHVYIDLMNKHPVQIISSFLIHYRVEPFFHFDGHNIKTVRIAEVGSMRMLKNSRI